MAMVWITHIYNFRPETFVLQQNDPTYHPVINGHQYNNAPIYITPGFNAEASWFVIPWASTGKVLTAHGPKGNMTFDVRPAKASDDNDSLRVYDAEQNESVNFEVGPKGPNWVASCSLHLVFNSNRMLFQVFDANHIGATILSHLSADLEKMAESFLEKLVSGLALPSGARRRSGSRVMTAENGREQLDQSEEDGLRLYAALR